MKKHSVAAGNLFFYIVEIERGCRPPRTGGFSLQTVEIMASGSRSPGAAGWQGVYSDIRASLPM